MLLKAQLSWFSLFFQRLYAPTETYLNTRAFKKLVGTAHTILDIAGIVHSIPNNNHFKEPQTENRFLTSQSTNECHLSFPEGNLLQSFLKADKYLGAFGPSGCIWLEVSILGFCPIFNS